MTVQAADLLAAAVAAHKAGDFETAERGYWQIGHFRSARRNVGVLYSQWGRLPEAERVLRDVLKHFPDDVHAAYSLSMVLLAQEKWAEGWSMHEARRNVGLAGILTPETDAPEWLGEDPAGKSIIVCAEQGYGDQIMWGRYLTHLRDRGAEVTAACNAAISPLFSRLGFATVPFTPARRAIPPGDGWALFGSLPLRLGLESPPPPLNLRIPHTGGGGIGVVPTGSPNHGNDRFRSLPPEFSAELLTMGRDLRPEATGAHDFLESAHLIAGLDGVITVDTSVAHLAGSLGVPTRVLLPAVATDWRWLRDRSDSPWYPSATLYRQKTPGDWASVVEGARLRTHAAG